MPKTRIKVDGIKFLGRIVDGQFTQEGARALAHDPEDAGYADCVVCVCGHDLKPCQACCNIVHADETQEDKHGDPVCADCHPERK